MALPVAAAISESLQPLGIAPMRERALAGLDRLHRDEPAPMRAEAAAGTQIPGPAAPVPVALVSVAPVPVMPVPAASAPAAPPQPPVITAAALPVITQPKAPRLPALPPPAPGKPRVVALVGDSMMAVGLSATLLRSMTRHESLQPVRAFRSGTGLSRPEVFDWMAKYPAMLGGQQPEVILVAIGANDGQGFVENGKVQAFGSDAWAQTYQSRLTAFLDMLTQQGAQVLWLSLPPMRLTRYNANVDTINRIAYQVVSRHPRAAWLNTAAYVGDGTGKYQEYMQGKNNRVIRLRADDGIHLSDQGAALLSEVLLAWLDPPAPLAGAPNATPSANGRP
jgi:hypothetical protein